MFNPSGIQGPAATYGAQQVAGPPAQYGPLQVYGPTAYYPYQTDMTGIFSTMMPMVMMILLLGFLFMLIKPMMERVTS